MPAPLLGRAAAVAFAALSVACGGSDAKVDSTKADSATVMTTPPPDTTTATPAAPAGPAPPPPELVETFVLGQLPLPLRDALERRGCKVPRMPGDSLPNLVRGRFIGPAEDTWAIWCVSPSEGRLLVFRDGDEIADGDLEVALAESPEPGRVFNSTAPEGQGYGCIGGIGRVDAATMAPIVRNGRLLGGLAADSLTSVERMTIAHEGIDDHDCHGQSNIHYWTGTRWVLFVGPPRVP